MLLPRIRGHAIPLITRVWCSLIAVFILSVETGCERRTGLYYSRVTFEYVAVPGTDAKASIQSLLPKGDSTVTLSQQKNAALYEIGVYDRVPQKAADRANALAVEIRTKIESKGVGAKFKIWERAQPGLYPER